MKRLTRQYTLIAVAFFACSADQLFAQDNKEPKFLGEKFRYPQIEKDSASLQAPDLEALRVVTKDDFRTVCKHYEKIAVEMVHPLNARFIRDAFGPGGTKGIDMIGPDIFVMNDVKSRQVSMLTFVRCGDDYQLTLVISRAKEESLTHITIVFRATEKKKK